MSKTKRSRVKREDIEYSMNNMKFVSRDYMLKSLGRPTKKDKTTNPTDRYKKWNTDYKFEFEEWFLENCSDLSDVESGDFVFTSYHGNDLQMVTSVTESNIEINNKVYGILKEGQFLKYEE